MIQINIFAKYGTNTKTLIICPRSAIPVIQQALIDKYGGNWLLVDKLHANDFLLFNDETPYYGFHGKDERYSSTIQNLDSLLL